MYLAGCATKDPFALSTPLTSPPPALHAGFPFSRGIFPSQASYSRRSRHEPTVPAITRGHVPFAHLDSYKPSTHSFFQCAWRRTRSDLLLQKSTGPTLKKNNITNPRRQDADIPLECDTGRSIVHDTRLSVCISSSRMHLSFQVISGMSRHSHFTSPSPPPHVYGWY